MSEQVTVEEPARQALAAKGIDLDALADLPTNMDRAQEFARRGIAVASTHFRPDDHICSCGDLRCPTPGAHPIHRHHLQDPWQCRLLDDDMVERAWRARPLAGVGFQLQLRGEKYERRFALDGNAIRECISIVQIR